MNYCNVCYRPIDYAHGGTSININFNREPLVRSQNRTDQEESQSTPALLTVATNTNVCNSSVSLGMIPEHTLLESCARLSVSLEGPSLFTVPPNRSHSTTSSHSSHSSQSQHNMTMDELRAVNRYAESTKSLTYLPQVSDQCHLQHFVSVA